MVEVILSKEEALAFAKKYLEDRTPINSYNLNGFHLAVEYIVNDIIPYLYGDVLD